MLRNPIIPFTYNMDQHIFKQDKPHQIISSVWREERYLDATIVCDGKYIRVNRMVLSAYSTFLAELFDNASIGLHHLLVHPVIVFPGVKKEHMEALLEYVYNGQVTIANSDLPMFIETATYLKFKGLNSIDITLNNTVNEDNTFQGKLKLESNSTMDTGLIETPPEKELESVTIKDEPIINSPEDKYSSNTSDTCNSEPKKRKIEFYKYSSLKETQGNSSRLQQPSSTCEKDSHDTESKLQGSVYTNVEWAQPSYSYKCLIALAMKNSADEALSAKQIHGFICEHFPYYQTAKHTWKKSISNLLGESCLFEKMPGYQSPIMWFIRPCSWLNLDADLNRIKRNNPNGIKNAMRYPHLLEQLEQGNVRYGDVSVDEN